MGRDLEKLVFNPLGLRSALIYRWDTVCAKKIVRGKTIDLDGTMRALIDAFDFGRVMRMTVDDILGDDAALPVLARRFGADPGPATRG